MTLGIIHHIMTVNYNVKPFYNDPGKIPCQGDLMNNMDRKIAHHHTLQIKTQRCSHCPREIP